MTVKYFLVAPLQNFFTDANGNPAVGGYLYSFKATDHATKKNIAKIEKPILAGDFYTDPIELDASGSIPVPYLLYYADDELYYIVLTNSNQNPADPPVAGNIIRTWDNFGVQKGGTPTTDEVDYTNYIQNSQYRFWRKQSYEQSDLTATNEFIYIADSGWYFKRNNNSADIAISFETFAPGQTDVPNNPIYYLNFQCTSIGSGEMIKDIVFKTDDVRTFANSTIQLAVYAKSDSNDLTEIVITQHFGVSADVTVIQSRQLTSLWTQYTHNIDIPDINGKSIDEDDNYLTISLRAHLNAVANIDVDNWQINRGDTLLEYNYLSKELEMRSQRTYQMPYANDDCYGLKLRWTGLSYEFDEDEVGDYIQSDKTARTGYLLCDGSSYATADKTPDGYLTYERLWNAWEYFVNHNGNIYGYGSDGFWPAGIYTNNIIFINTKESTNITDWTDNDTGFTFTKIHDGGDTGIQANKSGMDFLDETLVDAPVNSNQILFVNKSNGNVTDATAGTTAFTVQVKQQGTAGLPETTLINFVAEASINGGESFLISSTTTDYYVWYKKAGVGVDPAIGGRTGILVELPSIGLSAAMVAEITRKIVVGSESTRITTVAASALSGGEYFRFYNSTIDYVGYITIDGVGADPEIANTTSVEIPLSSSDTDLNVAVLLARYVRKVWFQVPDRRGMIIRMTDGGRGFDPDADNRYLRGDSVEGDNVGTWQRDQMREHKHLEAQNTGSDIAHSNGQAQQGTASGLPKQITESTGGNETRMINIYTNYFVKY